jgi:hypothetical protein
MDMTSTQVPHRLEHSIASDGLSVIDVRQEYIQKGMWIYTMHASRTQQIEHKVLTYVRRVIENYAYPIVMYPHLFRLWSSQNPPIRFFPVAAFFPAGSRPPKRPGNSCVLAMVGCESVCVSGPVKSVMSKERPPG